MKKAKYISDGFFICCVTRQIITEPDTETEILNMKTERIEFVAPSGLKTKLQNEAAEAKISVGELIRQRFESSEEELELKKLTAELKQATSEASRELKQAVENVDTLIKAMRSRRKKAELEAA